MLNNGPELAGLRANSLPFTEHFAHLTTPEVVSFTNLGKDATLIAPTPTVKDQTCYSHLGNFLRGAPGSQIDALWRHFAEGVRALVSNVPIWPSTAGLGASWLHLRIDSKPKYYRYEPYSKIPTKG